MKKLLVILCALALLVFAAACQKQDEQPENQAQEQENGGQEVLEPEDSAKQEEQPGEAEAASDDPERPGETELPVSLEGQDENMPVILWQTESFSIYVPSEGWTKNDDQVWQPNNNQDVRFFVLKYEDADAESAQAQVQAAYPDYSFQAAEGISLQGKDDTRQMIMLARLVENGSDCFAVCAQYPLEAAEGYGARLSALADTFEAK